MVFDRTQWLRWIEMLCLTSIFLGSFLIGIRTVPFKDDESQWIATSSYFEPFVRGDVTNPVWRDSYWTRTQPPVTRYVIAMGRLAGGYSAAELNKPWSWNRDEAGNIAAGAMPNSDLLWWSRLPMVLFATLSGLCLYFFARLIAGRVAGYAAALLIVVNPYFLLMFCRAMSEAPLVAGILLAACAAQRALSAWFRVTETQLTASGFRQWCWWFLVIGMCAGIAGATKLNGLAVSVAAVTLALVAVTWYGRSMPIRTRLVWAGAGFVVALTTTILVFVAVNPYVYAYPYRHTLTLFEQRLHELQLQANLWPEDQVGTGITRVVVIAQRVFSDYAVLQGSWALMLNISVFALGCAALIRATTSAGQTHRHQAGAVVLVVMGLAVALPSLATPLDWDRYYLLPVVWTTLCTAIGIGQIAAFLWDRRPSGLIPNPPTDNTRYPARKQTTGISKS